MALTFAFLRGMNVGGHRVAMETLRTHFEELGFEGVQTFIASGNVAFEGQGLGRAPALQTKIEAHLTKSLGYAVPTVIRSAAQLRSIVAKTPFSPLETSRKGAKQHVTLYPRKLKQAEIRALESHANPEDRLHAEGAELYWLRQGGLLDTTVDSKSLRKAVGVDGTLRTHNTLERMLAKFG